MVGAEPRERILADLVDGLADLPSALFDQKMSQERNVFLSLTQRWHQDRKDIESVIQIFAECLCPAQPPANRDSLRQ